MNTARWQVPDFTLRPFAREMAWHYTPASNLEGIIQAGALLPHRPFSGEAQKSVIFFPVPRFAAVKPVIFFTSSRFSATSLLTQHGCQRAWLRFGYEGGDLLPVAQMSFLMSETPAKISEEEYLYTLGVPRGLVDDWRVSFRPIAVEEFSFIQASDDNGVTWRTLFTNPERAAGHPPNN